jgi:hypothetical protein
MMVQRTPPGIGSHGQRLYDADVPQDAGTAMLAAALRRYGCTWIGAHFNFSNGMPRCGFKPSGYAKDFSIDGLEDETAARSVVVKL